MPFLAGTSVNRHHCRHFFGATGSPILLICNRLQNAPFKLDRPSISGPLYKGPVQVRCEPLRSRDECAPSKPNVGSSFRRPEKLFVHDLAITHGKARALMLGASLQGKAAS
jgi:hypothetical protein